MTGRAGSDGGRAGSGAGRDNTVAATAEAPERAYLIAVDTGGDAGWSAEESLGELAALVEAAGGDVVGSAVQRRETIHPLWYLGKGKAEELKPAKGQTQFTMLVADDELSPKQQRSLEELLNVKVLDRSGIILDIFAQRAHTHEGRIQVELAQLKVPAAPADPHVDTPVSYGRRHRYPARSRRDAARDRPARDPGAYQEDPGTGGGGPTAQGDGGARPRAALAAYHGDRGIHQRGQIHSSERAGRGGGGGRGRHGLRDARPDDPPGPPG